jgi:hypothetical protein
VGGLGDTVLIARRLATEQKIVDGAAKTAGRTLTAPQESAMYRSLVALLAAAPLVAAPGVKEKDRGPVLYYPVKVGAKWVTELSAGGAAAGPAIESVETVTKVEEKDGVYRITSERDLRGKSFITVMEVSAGGVRRVGINEGTLSESPYLIRVPAKPGDTWAAGGGTVTVGPEEAVEVPAGKFKAIPVTTVIEQKAGTLTMTAWYSPGVGVVKQVSRHNTSEATQVLKSFTPGK